MRRDRLRDCRARDEAADPDGSRYATRRRVIAAVAATGFGLGAVGVRHGGRGPDEHPAWGNDGTVGTATAGGPASRGAEATPAGRSAESDEGADGSDTDQSGVPADSPVIGANLNGRPRRLAGNLELLDASNTTWVRAFLDIRRKVTSGVPPENDPDVVALRQAAVERNCKLVVSLKWDFKANWGDKEPIPVPRPGSTYERELHGCGLRCLRAIGAPVDVVVLGNEPMWETLGGDVRVEDSPIVGFTRRAKEHLVQHGDHGDPKYLVGAFNRAHDDHTREQQFPHFYRQMFEFVREDDDVDGIDLHIHYGEFAEAQDTVAVARGALPDEMITATEFSPVWRYDRHKDTPIAEFDGCEQFLLDHDLPAGLTAVEYFEHAKRNPRPPAEVADFYDALPWYNVNHVEDVYRLFAEYDVSIGTFGFLAGLRMRNEDWTGGWTPFHINFLFQPVLIQADDGLEQTANRHYLEDYRTRAVPDRSGSK